MDKSLIHLDDIKRILLGQAPPVFMVEVFLRTFITYIGLLFFVRLLGKRMQGQLTVTEMAVMLTLGAIVSPAMQMPDRGILVCLFVLGCIVFFERFLTLLNFKSKRAEELTQGKLSVLVEDGKLIMEEMKVARISHQQLYQVLREEEIYNLGDVERVYLEACGIFSIYKFEKPKPGLSLMPSSDKELFDQQPSADGSSSCINCGFTKKVKENDTCPNCSQHEWRRAIIQ